MLIQLDRVDSTNDVAWSLIDQGWGDGTIVTARSQTRGRGQRGRVWESAVGGLYLSMIYLPAVKLTDPPILTMGVVWGIYEVLSKFIPGLGIKAPNDLMVGQYKLGGILTETRLLGEQIIAAVIGVGINGWNPLPPGAIGIKDLDSTIANLDQLRELTIQGILLGKEQWERSEDLSHKYHLLIDRR